MTVSTKLPFCFQTREVQPGSPKREPVEVQLAPDTVELDILYEDRDLNQTARRIKPVGLTVLANGELAIIAICQLRNEQRSFAISRILEAVFPGFSAKPLKGEDLVKWLEPDVRRLVAHDATINGTVIRPARPYQSSETRYNLADMEIFEGEIPLEDLPETSRAAPGLFTELAQAITDFAEAVRVKSSHKLTPVTVTMERRDGSLRIHVDTCAEIAQQIRDGSNHARMAFLGTRMKIETAAARFYTSLAKTPSIGHDDLGLRVALTRGGSTGSPVCALAVDGNWINLELNAPSTVATKLRAALNRLASSTGISPMTETPPEWMVETTRGVFHVRAARAEDAAPRLLALGAFNTLHVIAVARVLDPASPMRSYSMGDAA